MEAKRETKLETRRGTILKVFPKRGYGFILEDNGASLFFTSQE